MLPKGFLFELFLKRENMINLHLRFSLHFSYNLYIEKRKYYINKYGDLKLKYIIKSIIVLQYRASIRLRDGNNVAPNLEQHILFSSLFMFLEIDLYPYSDLIWFNFILEGIIVSETNTWPNIKVISIKTEINLYKSRRSNFFISTKLC